MAVEIKTKAIEKLIDYTASGIGSIAGPMLAPWQARREGKAKLIRAETDADILKLQAQAQAEARKLAIEPASIESGTVTISDQIEQSLKFQAAKRFTNVRSVVEKTAEAIHDEDVPVEEPNHDWTARFFDSVQDVSTQQLHSIWSKILADEIRSPGSTSLLTLNILKNIDIQTATLFELFCSMCIYLLPDVKNNSYVHLPTLGQHAGQNSLKKYGLNYRNLMTLTEHDLISTDFNSTVDIQICIGKHIKNKSYVKFPFLFNGKYWILQPTQEYKEQNGFKVQGIAVTKAGRELSRIVSNLNANDFLGSLKNYFLSKKLLMRQVEKIDPIIVDHVAS